MIRIHALLIGMLVVLCFAATAAPEVPQLINYQGRLTASDGSPAVDGTYNINFQMYEHNPPPMGESPIWQSGYQPVQVTDGLFVYLLGSATPLPTSVFNDDNLDSYFIRLQLEGTMLASQGIQMVTVPFAFRAATADTAMYAHDAPGGTGDGGWTDDGSVVRLTSSSDKVGIGTSAPTDRLVVGGNLGTTIDDTYIVVRNNHETTSGYRLGFDNNNFGWMRWSGYDGFISFGTRQIGINYLGTLVLNNGNVGIGVNVPLEPLVIGEDLGSYYGDFVQIGRTGSGRYSGLMFGEDEDNRGTLMWTNNNNEVRLGYKSGGTDYGNHLTLRNGEMILTGSGNSSVQLPDNAISDTEILDEPGVHSVYRSTSFTINETLRSCLDITCDFPTSGYAMLIGTAQVLTWDFGGSVNNYQLHYGIADNAGSAPFIYYKDFGNNSSCGCNMTVAYPITVHEYFAVSAGTNTFKFVVRELDQIGTTDGTSVVEKAHLSLMFFPTQYAAKDGSESGIVPEGSVPPTMYSAQPEPTNEKVGRVASSDIDRLLDENAELRRRLEALEAMIGK